MKESENNINMALQGGGCHVISPGHKYIKNDSGIIKDKITRNLENLSKLENIISECMIKLYQGSLLENLRKEVPILYIDCEKKGESDIMFFIFKECMRKLKMENKENLVSKIIGERTIITPYNSDVRKAHIRQNKPDTEGIFNYYHELLKTHLDLNDAEYMKSLLNFESDITFAGLEEFMELQNINHLYLYLDKIQNLNIDEQSRINRFLGARGGIENDKRVRLKINNGSEKRESRTSYLGHRINESHDYSETRIPEEDL